MIHICKPYALDLDLGKAYNETMRLLGDDDWACLMDYDTMFLTHDCGKILHDYVEMYAEECGMFTCFANRIHPLAKDQLLGGEVSENTDIRYHMDLAEKQKELLYTYTPIIHEISGFLMMVSKKTWNVQPFPETGHALGVDNIYSSWLLQRGYNIYRMDGLYVFHLYRLKNGISDKTHLRK